MSDVNAVAVTMWGFISSEAIVTLGCQNIHILADVCMSACLCVCSAGMVCAFVTNQLLHDQTSSSAADDDDDDGSAHVGLVTSLVDSVNAVDSYQQSTLQVTCLCLSVLCMAPPGGRRTH